MNKWVMMDESLSYMERWLRMMMRQVIAVVEKGIGLTEAVSNVKFCICDH
jgi:ABC-type sugar transport system ATPase subunit